MSRLLVVGNGLATDRLLDELLARGSGHEITVVGEEPGGSYNRILLARVLTGADPDDIVTKPVEWYAENGIRLLTGRYVWRLDTRECLADIGNGESIGYDTAVLATGSEPRLPPVSGLTAPDGTRTPGVHVFRTLEDVLELRADLDGRRRSAVVVGAGLLGLEAAKALVDLGHETTLVHPSETLMDTQLDGPAGGLVREAMERLGVRVVVGRVADVLARDRVEALSFGDGRVLGADLVVFTIGVRPRIDLAVRSGLETGKAIVVDDALRTSDPHVHAIGECAEHRGVTVGLVAPCWDQAALLARQLTEGPGAGYVPGLLSTRLKVAGVEVSSMGVVEPEYDTDEVVQILEPARRRYRKLVVREGRLAGAVLVGDPDRAPDIARIFERAVPVPADPVDLFCSAEAFAGTAAGEPDVCVCNRVTESALRAAIARGCGTVQDLQRETRAGTGCGSCLTSLTKLVAEVPARAG
jgi:nitrite reductase (NADH) large subunit